MKDMADFEDESALAPKVFFIDPDPEIVSESFIEMAFFLGFETYAIPDDLCGDLKTKVELLAETYPDLILFFTIDRKSSLQAWTDYLKELHECHEDCVRIGVLYSQKSFDADQQIKKTFNFDRGIVAGCVPLEASFRKSQTLLLEVLEANWAMGRRRVIRMKCNPTFRMNFLTNGTLVEGSLHDLSVSYFSASFQQPRADWDMGTKIRKIQLRLGGKVLMVNALIAIKRVSHEVPTFVFLFHPETDQPGQEDVMRSKVNQIICHDFQSKVQDLLEKYFDRCAEEWRSAEVN
jgi:hypothetical protein